VQSLRRRNGSPCSSVMSGSSAWIIQTRRVACEEVREYGFDVHGDSTPWRLTFKGPVQIQCGACESRSNGETLDDWRTRTAVKEDSESGDQATAPRQSPPIKQVKQKKVWLRPLAWGSAAVLACSVSLSAFVGLRAPAPEVVPTPVATATAIPATPEPTAMPPPTLAMLCDDNEYQNSAGDCVLRPNDDPVGATARCRDGTYYRSQSRKVTCSSHGVVENWF